jgi:hypothetical protein
VEDDGYAVHYAEVSRGTRVVSADGQQVGVIHKILDNYRERIFDGIVVKSEGGEKRFVDAPEVARTAERAVTLTISAAEFAELPLERSRMSLFRRR